jgi:hypothetical protein
MPVFFVDICLNNSLIEDEEGIEFPSIPTAEAHCIAGLLDVAKRLVTASPRRCATRSETSSLSAR